MCTPNRVPPIPKTGGWPEVLNPDQQVGPSMIPYGKKPQLHSNKNNPMFTCFVVGTVQFLPPTLGKGGGQGGFFLLFIYFLCGTQEHDAIHANEAPNTGDYDE